MLSALFFYLFAVLCVGAGFMVIAVKNPVHAVLFLILAFFNAAGLFVLLGAEFLAMILVVVYVGAVLVLFLFVVMMLDVDFAVLRAGFFKYLPIGAAIGLLLLVELVLIVGAWITAPDIVAQAPTPPVADISNTEAIGLVQRSIKNCIQAYEPRLKNVQVRHLRSDAIQSMILEFEITAQIQFADGRRQALRLGAAVDQSGNVRMT